MNHVLRSSRVLLGGGADPIRIVPADVQIQGDLIVGVAAPDPDRAAQDLGERLITPAFINAHTHLAMGYLRGLATPAQLQGNVVEDLYFQIESHLQAGDVRAFSRIAAVESALAGVGCVWDHYYFGREVADALLDVGLCGVVAPTLQDLSGPGVAALDLQWQAMVDMTADARLAAAGIVTALGPHATDTVSSDLWTRVARHSADANLPVHAHVAQSVEEYQRSLIEHGCSPIARLRREGALDAAPAFLLVHGLYVDRSDLTLLDPQRHLLVHCPWSQVQFGFPARVGWWRQAGLSMAIGTDCGACNDTMDVQQELRLAAWGGSYSATWSAEADAFGRDGNAETARALDRRRSIQVTAEIPDATIDWLLNSVWAVPGSAHPRLPLGAIAPGRRANLLVFDTDHPVLWPGTDLAHALTQTTVAPAIHTMYVNGRPIATPGDHQRGLLGHPDLRAWRQEANGRMRGLMARAGVSP